MADLKKEKHIVEMYVRYFGRVATKDEIGSFNDVKSLSKITAEVRVNAANESGLKGSDYLNSIIQNLFGRSEANAFESKYAKKLDDNVYYNLPIATIIKKGSKDDKGVYNAKKLVAEMVAAKGGSYELDNITQENYKSIYNVKKGLTVKTIDELEAKISNVPDIINGKIYTLSTGVDAGKEFTGTDKNDLFSANSTIVVDNTGSKVTLDTLDSLDVLDGGKGIDTLSVTLAGAATATAKVNPTLKSIENVNVEFAAVSNKLNLTNATGVEKVTVNDSTAATVGTVEGVGAAKLAVKNQALGATFEDSTATALDLTVEKIGVASGAAAVVVVDSTVADTATSLTLNTTDSNVNLDSTNNDAYKTVTINATGTNKVALTDVEAVVTDLTVKGSGSLVVTNALTALKTLTATENKGGVTLNATGGVLETANTGSGNDVLTVVGTNIKTISTGAGDDSVTDVTTGLGATSVVNLGAGDDTYTMATVVTAGATIDGGTGTDTLAMTSALAATVSGATVVGTAISNFEKLSLGATSVANTVNMDNLDNINYVISAGVTANGLTINNMTSGGTLELTGAVATASAINIKNNSTTDRFTVKLNGASNLVNTALTTIANVETVNVVTSYTGAVNPTVASTALLAIADATNVTVSGNLGVNFTGSTVTKVTTLDASKVVATGTTDANIGTSGAVTFTSAVTAENVTVTTGNGDDAIDLSSVTDITKVGTITTGAGNDTITGTSGNDVINAGAGNDTVTGGAGADTITLGAGNDTYKLVAVSDSTISSTDKITDFNAKTATTAGDVIDLGGLISAGAASTISVFVANNASDAMTHLQNVGADATTNTGIALDKSTGKLYIDVDKNGTADSVIELSGVTTITVDAFTNL